MNIPPKHVVLYPAAAKAKTGNGSGLTIPGDVAASSTMTEISGNSTQARYVTFAGTIPHAGEDHHALVCDSRGTAVWARDILRRKLGSAAALAMDADTGELIEHSPSVYIASRMVAGKPVLREGLTDRDGDAMGSNQPPLNLGDNELRANNVGDQDAWRPANAATPQGKAQAIRMAMDRRAKSAQPKAADQLPAPMADNQPPPTSGQDNWPALQLPDGMR